MKLSKLYIKGFRNFKEATINFNNQSLIIGANDVGKTNLLYALRILLDRGFSDLDLELKESDFYAYEETNEVIITAFFDDIKEDCILSKMKGDISGDGNLVREKIINFSVVKVMQMKTCMNMPFLITARY